MGRPAAGDPPPALFRQLFLQAADAILVLAVDGRVVDANPRATDMFGMAGHELRERRLTDLLGPDWLVPIEEGLKTVAQRGVARFHLRMRRASGEVFPGEVAASRVELAEQELVQAVVRDLSARGQLQEQLQQAQKLESVGRLAGGIAHDFNNLLTSVLGYADILLSDTELPEAARGHLEEIRRAGLRAAALIRQLLAFSRRQVLRPGLVDLNRVIAELEPMLRRFIGEDVDLATCLDRELAPVMADRSQMEQVIMNLVVNARDAMPRGGRLRLATANADVDEAAAAAYPGFRAGRYVRLEVEDTGHGMDAMTRARIFEPFFTTKGREGGSGLGLSTAYGIIKQTGGWIYAESAPGQGTTFRIFLAPAPDRLPAGGERANGRAPALAGGETILVVEDEGALRSLVVRVLGGCGYRVVEAAGGREALETFVGYSGRIDLLLSDVVIPGLSGPQLAKRLKERQPELKVLFMTGYSDETITQHGLEASRVDVVQKPFTAEALAARVRRALDEG